MLSEKKLINVNLQDVNIDLNGPFTTSYAFTIDRLLYSISKIGLIYPPLLLDSEHSGFEIVSGLRRILACLVLGINEIPAYLVKDKNRGELFLQTFFENYAVRSFNQVELAMAIVRFNRFFSKSETFSFLAFLGQKPSEDTIGLCNWMVEKLPDDFKIMIAHGRISQKFLWNLKELSQSDIIALIKLCTSLQLSQNYQNEIFSILRDISLLKERGIAELLNEFGVWEVLSKKLTVQQKTKLIVERLREWRNPMIKSTKDKIEKVIRALNLERGLFLDLNPSFEEDTFVLKLYFRDGADLGAKLERLVQNKRLLTLQDPASLGLDLLKLEETKQQ